MMKNNALILTDIEGISGVSSIEAINQESPAYTKACESLMQDTNTAVAALKDSGCDKVYVLDGHGKGENFIKEKLDKRAIQITIPEMSKAIKEVDCVILIGMHAMSGTLCAFLDHTQSSIKIHNYFYNGKRIGEISQIGAFAGHFGVPCVTVSGDEAVCAQAIELIDGICTATVKIAKSRNLAECLPNNEAQANIYNAVKSGFIKKEEIKPLNVTLPLHIKVEFNRSDYCDDACESNKNLKRIDAFTAESIKETIECYSDVLL